MVQEIAHLSPENQATVMDAIPYITLLIAGADGEIDEAETAWAEKIADIRAYTNPDKLNNYYAAVGERFETRLMEMLSTLPEDTDARTAAISAELEKLNTILPELPHFFAQALYDSMVSFAKHVAKASGGFLGMMSVSEEEADLMDLPMIKPFN